MEKADKVPIPERDKARIRAVIAERRSICKQAIKAADDKLALHDGGISGLRGLMEAILRDVIVDEIENYLREHGAV